MTKIDIISGFLGAGKTTLIKKLINQVFQGEKLVLIENEFGEIGIDGGFLKDAGIEITEMNSGCICCSLVGDFGTALKKVIDEYAPDRIIIEPSGVGKLSDVIKAVEDVKASADIIVNSATTVVDVSKCKMYMKNFGEFFNNQVESAGTIILSRTQNVSDDKVEAAVNMLREHNGEASIITTPWDDLDAKIILDAMEHANSLDKMIEEAKKMAEHEHHHHEHGEDCTCGCHDHGERDEHEHDEHEHHHHEHGEDCTCGCHDHEHHDHDDHEHHDHDEHEHHHHDHDGHEHHHHEHGEDCACGCHDHDHEHHHHHADDVFTSWGVETSMKYSEDEMKAILEELAKEENDCGIILRAKGIVSGTGNEWLYFDLTPGEYEIRKGNPDYTGKLCVIGSNLNEGNIAKLFKLS